MLKVRKKKKKRNVEYRLHLISSKMSGYLGNCNHRIASNFVEIDTSDFHLVRSKRKKKKFQMYKSTSALNVDWRNIGSKTRRKNRFPGTMENRRVSIIGWLPFSIRLIYYTNVCSWRRTPDYNSDRGWFINHIADVISIPGSKHDWSRLRGKNHASSPCLIIDVAWKIKSLKGGKNSSIISQFFQSHSN